MDYFTKQDLTFFSNLANTTYDKDDEQSVLAGKRIRETIFNKVSLWGELLINSLKIRFS